MTSTTKVVVFEGSDYMLCGQEIVDGGLCEMTLTSDGQLSLCCRVCTEDDCTDEYLAMEAA